MRWNDGSHGSTFGGNPLSCAAALATLRLLRGGLVENAGRVGARLLEKLRALGKRHRIVGDVRGLGLMIAVELRGNVPESASAELTGLPGAVVMGPMSLDDGKRWLLTGTLGEARLQLRRLVGRWRDGGATVRVDADPIDV